MIITLLSDFGSKDFSVGMVKGILLGLMPEMQLIDLSHEVSSFHLLQGAYFLQSSFPYFPKGTIHLSLLGVEIQPDRPPLIMKVRDQYIVSADNGFLPLTFEDSMSAEAEIYAIPLQNPLNSFTDYIEALGSFLKQLLDGAIIKSQLEVRVPFEISDGLKPYVEADEIRCQVIHIDPFGNVVLNLKQDLFEAERKGRDFEIRFSRYLRINRISRFYSEVPSGEKLCLFNAGGYLEIAVNQGSAAQLFGFELSRSEQLVYHQVMVHFLNK